MKKLKNILLIVAALMLAVLVAPTLPGAGDEASADTAWTNIGTCRYQIVTTGTGESQEVTLTIAPKEGQASGTLPDGYGYLDWSWNDTLVANEITKVVIESGVKAGDSTAFMFIGMINCSEIQGLSNLDTSDTVNMEGMFQACRNLTNLAVSNFNTAKVTNMSNMFANCPKLTSLAISNFDTAKVKDMSDMFYWCSKLASLDLSNFDTSEVTDMGNMFYMCSNLKTIKVGSKWSVAAVTFSDGMFTECTSLVGGAGTVYNAKHVDAAYAKVDGGKANPGYLSDNTTSNTTSCYIVKATAGKTSAKFTWSKVTGAKYYKVLFSKCGKSKCKAIKKTTATSFTKKGLKAKTSYKAYILAYNAKGKQIAKSKVIHIMTKGGKYSNATKVTAKTKLTVTAGKTAKLGAKIAKKDSKKKLVNHCAALRYYSADKTIAKVSKKGVVTGVKAGTTYVYAVAPSGVSAKCKVTVKAAVEMVTVTFTTSDNITFSDNKGKLTGQNTISVPKGCTTDLNGMLLADEYPITFSFNGTEYVTVTARGNGTIWIMGSTIIDTDQTISVAFYPPQ